MKNTKKGMDLEREMRSPMNLGKIGDLAKWDV
jgi:hypothetical protein